MLGLKNGYHKITNAVLLLLLPSVSLANVPIPAGSKTAYHYDSTQTATPAGYYPFYINHVGRHGSRYISKDKFEKVVYNVLVQADKQQQLTAAGKQLLAEVITLMQLNAGHDGQLTDLGRHAMSQIGQRMLAHYPTVFTGKGLSVISSAVPRAVESAELFLQPFSANYPAIQIQQQPKDQQTLLRFFDYSPAYQAYKKSDLIKREIKSIEQAPQTLAVSHAVAERIFSSVFLAQLDKGIRVDDQASTPQLSITKSSTTKSINSNDFVISLYLLYQELLSFTTETLDQNHLDFSIYFSTIESGWLDTVVTAKNYLQIGPAFDADGIQIKIAAPLLWDIIHTTDNAIAEQKVDANLRFGHAETLSPLATLLEIENSNIVAKSLFTYPAVWQAARIIPMGANIQFIFYRPMADKQAESSSQNTILVKVLLNEQAVHLPIATGSYPYYRWDDVKQFYVAKLNRLGLFEDQTPLTMLQNMK